MPTIDDSLYITEIKADNHPFIKLPNVHIKTPNEQKKNIIITGKNGCGKTTLLKALKGHILYSLGHRTSQSVQEKTKMLMSSLKSDESKLAALDHSSLDYKTANEKLTSKRQDILNAGLFLSVDYSKWTRLSQKDHVLGFFEANRMTNLSKPTTISPPKIKHEAIGIHTSGELFLHHLVNRRSQLSFALEEGITKEASEIKNWFKNLEKMFSTIFERELTLKFLRHELDFVLESDCGEIIDMRKLSDGYSAIISIVTEIIIRMEAITFAGWNTNGIVFIDEVENHLHVALQRQILPFLYSMFPNIQFIVTTHSPFVLSSVQDAIILDLETGETIDQEASLWGYTYEALVEGYFEVENFSALLRDKIARYKELVEKNERNGSERKELRKLTKELKSVPTYKSPAIEAELKSLELK